MGIFTGHILKVGTDNFDIGRAAFPGITVVSAVNAAARLQMNSGLFSELQIIGAAALAIALDAAVLERRRRLRNDKGSIVGDVSSKID